MSYSSPEAAYVAYLVLAYVLAEFALPDIWPRLPLRLVYAIPVLAAPSLTRIAGLALLLAMLALVDRSAKTPGPAGLRNLLRAGLSAASVMVFAWLTAGAGPSVPNPALGLFGPLARLVLWVSVYLFMVPGGTALVRWVLDDFVLNPVVPGSVGHREGTTDPGAAALEAAVGRDGGSNALAPNLRLGRVIGNLERLIILALVTQGQYAAIGVVLAAKSIVRYERVTHLSHFADYYLIGTLMSMAVALAGGLALNFLEQAL